MTRQRGPLGERQLAFDLSLNALGPFGVLGGYVRIFQAHCPVVAVFAA